MTPGQAAHDAARTSYGRLVAYLALRTGDVAAAEDLLSEAFTEALTHWPERGVPESPEGWLLTVARRKWSDAQRRAAIARRPETVHALQESLMKEAPPRFADERIRLMLVCAHPAIEPGIRPALILQVVLGVEAKVMASAFLLSREAMTKRLVRAKERLRSEGVRFEEPAPEDLAPRLHALLEALYAAYALGRESALHALDPSGALDREALYLARLVADSLPDEAEAQGFLAMLELTEARRPAQYDAQGRFVPLLSQETSLWDRALLEHGMVRLQRAAHLRQPGPFQLEAAIHAAHAYRARSGSVPWPEIAVLYDQLVASYPTLGAQVSRAVARSYADGDPEFGLSLLDELDAATMQPKRADVGNYQPYWVARANLLERAGRNVDALDALGRAIGLSTHPAILDFLEAWSARLRTPVS